MGELRTLLLEGIFYRRNPGEILVQTEQHPLPVSIKEALTPLIGEQVILVIHHHPQIPLDETRWGGGCCMWQNAGSCPAGHHETPAFLFNFSVEGILQWSDDGWKVAGQAVSLEMLLGHRSRLAVVTKFDQDSLRKMLDTDDLTKLGGQAAQMRDMLAGLRDFLREMKGD